MIKKLREVLQKEEKHIMWLKNNYVHQYIISSGRGPMTADAIRVSNTILNNIKMYYVKINNFSSKIKSNCKFNELEEKTKIVCLSERPIYFKWVERIMPNKKIKL